MACSSTQPSMASQMRHARTMKQMTLSASPLGCARHARLAPLPLYVPPSDPLLWVRSAHCLLLTLSHAGHQGAVQADLL